MNTMQVEAQTGNTLTFIKCHNQLCHAKHEHKSWAYLQSVGQDYPVRCGGKTPWRGAGGARRPAAFEHHLVSTDTGTKHLSSNQERVAAPDN